MGEHKNLKIICAVAAIIICVAAGGLHYMTRILRVSETDIIAFADKTGINPRRERAILRSVLLNTGQWRDWGSMDKANVGVILSRIKGRQKDAVIVARDGNGKTVVALYEKYNGNYLYTAMVDTFDEMRDLQILPLREQGGSLIVVRDHSANTLEDITHIRAYAWDEGNFQNVLNITENYKGFYNELWDENKPANQSNWIRLYERSDIIWENSDAPVVHVLLHQNYGLSGSAGLRERPDETDFNIIRNRDIVEDYVWSGKWMHFILFEGTDRENGEPVAVIHDLSGSPFGLIGQFNKAGGKYRVKYLDGTIEIVVKERIKPGIEVKRSRQM